MRHSFIHTYTKIPHWRDLQERCLRSGRLIHLADIKSSSVNVASRNEPPANTYLIRLRVEVATLSANSSNPQLIYLIFSSGH